MNKQNHGFTVKDYRYFNNKGQPRTKQELINKTKQNDRTTNSNSQTISTEQKKHQQNQIPPVDFSSLILSLSHTAIMYLGYVPDPKSGKNNPDLQLARHTIDTIAMLKEKTTGNLTKDEQQLVENVLTELRLVFVRTKT